VSPFGTPLHNGIKVTISDGYPPAASPEHIHASVEKVLDDREVKYKVAETFRNGHLFKSYSFSSEDV
jgi:hypothetical protein